MTFLWGLPYKATVNYKVETEILKILMFVDHERHPKVHCSLAD